MDLRCETVTRGRGCPACNQTGYRGRLAIHEVLPIDRTLKESYFNESKCQCISEYMKQARYHTLLEDGLIKVLEGLTTTEEVLRVATSD